MSNLAIDIDHVSKEFIVDGLGEYHRLTEAVTSWIGKRFSRSEPNQAASSGHRGVGTRRFLALDDVCLQVGRGETLGIVGSNGAGKSTLLKILSRIVSPSKGRVGVLGRVGCLLEVGTGFHPELTGRENVYLNGAILGMPRREIRKRFDEIIDFAEVAPFLDMPVKRYSNGMLIRLGFSVAAHLDPDVLIVDEVLGVGDSEFQKKSLGKARDFRDQGRTVLMVSHNLPMIASFCSRAVLLEHGKITADGSPNSIIDKHLRIDQTSDSQPQWSANSDDRATDYLVLQSVRVHGGTNPFAVGEPATGNPLRIDQPIQIRIGYQMTKSQKAYMQLRLRDETGMQILQSIESVETGRELTQTDLPLPLGQYESMVTIPADLLNTRRYMVSIAVGSQPNRTDLIAESLVSFSPLGPIDTPWTQNVNWDGFAVRPKLKWVTEKL